MGPLFDEDGNFIGDQVLESIVKEKYILTHMAGIPYGDLNVMTVLERKMLSKILREEFELKQQKLQESSSKIGIGKRG